MTIQIASQEYDSFECSLLNRRFARVLTFPIGAASTDAAAQCASAILQRALGDNRELVGFELRRNGTRVRTCLESRQTAAIALAIGAGEAPRGACSDF